MRYIMAKLNVQPNFKYASSCCTAGGLPVFQTFQAQVGFGVIWPVHTQRVIRGRSKTIAANCGPHGRLVLQGLHGNTVDLVPAIVWSVNKEEELARRQHGITGLVLLQQHVKLCCDAGKQHGGFHKRWCEGGPMAQRIGEGQSFQSIAAEFHLPRPHNSKRGTCIL